MDHNYGRQQLFNGPNTCKSPLANAKTISRTRWEPTNSRTRWPSPGNESVDGCISDDSEEDLESDNESCNTPEERNDSLFLKASFLGTIHTSELARSQIDLSPKRSECERSNANWDRSKIYLNECEHFLKANWDRSQIDPT